MYVTQYIRFQCEAPLPKANSFILHRTGAAFKVCAGGEPGAVGKQGSDVFSVGSAAERDHWSAIVFADSVGP